MNNNSPQTFSSSQQKKNDDEEIIKEKKDEVEKMTEYVQQKTIKSNVEYVKELHRIVHSTKRINKLNDIANIFQEKGINAKHAQKNAHDDFKFEKLNDISNIFQEKGISAKNYKFEKYLKNEIIFWEEAMDQSKNKDEFFNLVKEKLAQDC
jgi:hypothetical protein